MIEILKPEDLFLIERITDTDLGTGVSSTQVVKKYLDYPDASDYYISFTDIDKIGINPQSGYNTPIGIYTYPVVEFFEKYRPKEDEPIGKAAPFAGKAPYVNIIRNNHKGKFIEDISATYTKADLERDIQWIAENKQREVITGPRDTAIAHRMNSVLMNMGYKYSNYESWKREAKNIIRDVLESLSEQFARFPMYPGGRLWYVTLEVAKHMKGKHPVQWAKLMREMGYSGVADKSGIGIIHPSEPTQAVFFSKSSFDVIDRIQNIGAAQAYSQETAESLAIQFKWIFDNYIYEGHIEIREIENIILRASTIPSVTFYNIGAAAPFAIAHMMQNKGAGSKLKSYRDVGNPYEIATKFFVKFVDALEDANPPKDFRTGWNNSVYDQSIVTKYPRTTFTLQSPTVQPNEQEHGRSDYRLKPN